MRSRRRRFRADKDKVKESSYACTSCTSLRRRRSFFEKRDELSQASSILIGQSQYLLPHLCRTNPCFIPSSCYYVYSGLCMWQLNTMLHVAPLSDTIPDVLATPDAREHHVTRTPRAGRDARARLTITARVSTPTAWWRRDTSALSLFPSCWCGP